jgi:hypothetical protein
MSGFLNDLRQAVSNLAQMNQAGNRTPGGGGGVSGPGNTITADLNESQSVVLDSNGNGTARMSPYGTRYSGYQWQPQACYVSVAPVFPAMAPVQEAQAVTYVSYGVYSAEATDGIGTTATGSTGDTCSMSQTLKPGDWVTTTWTGGDAGALATMRITGQVTVPVP